MGKMSGSLTIFVSIKCKPSSELMTLELCRKCCNQFKFLHYTQRRRHFKAVMWYNYYNSYYSNFTLENIFFPKLYRSFKEVITMYSLNIYFKIFKTHSFKQANVASCIYFEYAEFLFNVLE